MTASPTECERLRNRPSSSIRQKQWKPHNTYKISHVELTASPLYLNKHYSSRLVAVSTLLRYTHLSETRMLADIYHSQTSQ
jgi:hypothetical protein